MSDKSKKLTRREFIQDSLAGTAILSSTGLFSLCANSKEQSNMPKRKLGKTGLQVSLLSFGGGGQFLKNKDGDWEPLLERAIELGINLFDTASLYKWRAPMSSEERYGKILPKYREEIYISTKFDPREPVGMRKELERSLKRMQTDYVDILMIHSIEPSDDVISIEKGIYKEMLSLKEEKIVRFVGFSSMDSSQKSKELIERLDFDVALLAMNPTKYGDFADIALPEARKKNVGVMAMKLMRHLVGKEATAKELINYALSQEGVATACIGHYGMKPLEENVRLVKEFTTETNVGLENSVLEKRLAHLAGPHALRWARADYRDGIIV